MNPITTQKQKTRTVLDSVGDKFKKQEKPANVFERGAASVQQKRKDQK